MKRNVAFSVLIVLFLEQTLFAGHDETLRFGTMEGFGRNVTHSPLAGKTIDVRIYKDAKNDPSGFKKYSISYDNISKLSENIKGIYSDIKDSSVIAIVPRDQDDKDVADAMGDSLFAERYDKLENNFNLTAFFGRGAQATDNIFFEDALGELLPSCPVEVYLQDSTEGKNRIFLGKMKTDGGLLTLPKIIGSLRTYSFIVSIPDYGIAQVDSIPFGNHIQTPLLRKDSEAFARAIHGKVEDQEGKPVSGAVIECESVRTLGEGLINGAAIKALTDKAGNFCFYMPNKPNPDERGYLIPPKSSYHVRITAPKELGLLPYADPIVNDGEKIIVMERAGLYRTFAFKDANGFITDPAKLQYIIIVIERPNKRSLRIGYNEFKDGGFYPPGEYKPNMFNPVEGELEFEPIVVDENSPAQVVFKLPGGILYSGQVVHGLTGQPMSGACVIAFNGSRHANLSMITKEQWQALHELPLNPSPDDPAIKPITDIYVIKKIVRADRQGYFRMSFIPGEIYGFIAFEENYLGLMHRRFALVPDENRIAEIPVMKLYPAATVLVTLKTEERLSVNPRWIIDVEDNPSWVRGFLATDDRSESLFTYDQWLENNIQQSFHIPAGLNVKVKINSPYNDKWCSIEIPQMLNLRQGQEVDLGSFTFRPAVEVYVQVLNSKGEPLEGVPVRSLVDNRIWSVAHNSDESGLSVFYVDPNSSSDIKFGVMYTGEGGKTMTETITCHIQGKEESGKLFKFRLSDEILVRMFNSGVTL